MLKRFRWLTNNRIVRLIGQFFVLCLCVGYIQYIYEVNILPDKTAQDVFQQTPCFLISKKLSTKGHFWKRYRADFYISYNVSGVQYNRWISGNGLDKGFASNESAQEDILSQFEVGGTYTCWYNAESPQQVLLVFRKNWFSTLHLIIPAALAVVTLYYFLKNLFYAVDSIVMKSRKRRKLTSKSRDKNET